MRHWMGRPKSTTTPSACSSAPTTLSPSPSTPGGSIYAVIASACSIAISIAESRTGTLDEPSSDILSPSRNRISPARFTTLAAKAAETRALLPHAPGRGHYCRRSRLAPLACVLAVLRHRLAGLGRRHSFLVGELESWKVQGELLGTVRRPKELCSSLPCRLAAPFCTRCPGPCRLVLPPLDRWVSAPPSCAGNGDGEESVLATALALRTNVWEEVEEIDPATERGFIESLAPAAQCIFMARMGTRSC